MFKNFFFYAEVKNHGEDFGIIYFRKIHRLFMQFFFQPYFSLLLIIFYHMVEWAPLIFFYDKRPYNIVGAGKSGESQIGTMWGNIGHQKKKVGNFAKTIVNSIYIGKY